MITHVLASHIEKDSLANCLLESIPISWKIIVASLKALPVISVLEKMNAAMLRVLELYVVVEDMFVPLNHLNLTANRFLE